MRARTSRSSIPPRTTGSLLGRGVEVTSRETREEVTSTTRQAAGGTSQSPVRYVAYGFHGKYSETEQCFLARRPLRASIEAARLSFSRAPPFVEEAGKNARPASWCARERKRRSRRSGGPRTRAPIFRKRFGRGGRIRTDDNEHPKLVHYQAVRLPEETQSVLAPCPSLGNPATSGGRRSPRRARRGWP